MNKIYLNSLKLKTFTEQDALDYCLLNNINPDKIIIFELYNNELINISGIKLFKNLERLILYSNELTDISVLKYLKKLKSIDLRSTNIKDISVIQYLKKLEILNINFLELESAQIKYINSLNNLKELICGYKAFKDRSVLNNINKNIKYY